MLKHLWLSWFRSQFASRPARRTRRSVIRRSFQAARAEVLESRALLSGGPLTQEPVLTINPANVVENGTVAITAAELNAVDTDTTDANLTYTVLDTSNGQVKLSGAPGTAINSFTQQVTAGDVVFVHDGSETTTGNVRLKLSDRGNVNPNTQQSQDAFGVEATGGSSRNATFSADGRYLAFQSDATNLVPNDTNGVTDVFVKDTWTGAIERVSVDSLGIEGNGNSNNAVISADGRYVAFASAARGEPSCRVTRMANAMPSSSTKSHKPQSVCPWTVTESRATEIRLKC